MSSPEKIDGILDAVLSEKGYLSICKEYSIFYRWKEIVGEKIDSVTRCDSIENGILYVKVTTSSWRQELSFLKKELLTKIKKSTQCTTIIDIVFH